MASDRRASTIAVSGTTVAIAVVLVTAILSGTAAAHPANETDHGVDERTFTILWSGDQDGDVHHSHEREDDELAALRQLANGTDVPLNEPPGAVAQWNRGDIEDFPETNASVSIHPPDADLQNGRFVRGAYAELFAVQPSTRARLSPGRTPLYVASSGEVFGAVDYRVDVPATDVTGDRRVSWRLKDHRINSTRLLVDNEQETTGNGSHTSAIQYERLGDYSGAQHTLTLEAEITVTLEKHVRMRSRHCWTGDGNTSCLTNWEHEYTERTERVTVSDSIVVREYEFNVSGFVARYPNGDLGLVVYKSAPWLGYSTSAGGVRGVWRFYSARDPAWDTLVWNTTDGEARSHSPLHPLQVTAFPTARGPSTTDHDVDILAVQGRQVHSPSLPENVSLNAATDPYTASYGIATRIRTDEEFSDVRGWGLVRGVTVRIREAGLKWVEIRRSTLTLSVVRSAENETTVRASLVDATTGEPINTSRREGHVLFDGQRLNTGDDGTVTVTVSRPTTVVSARYDPGHWWQHTPGYVGDSARIRIGGSEDGLLQEFFRFFLPVGLFLLTVYAVDRVTQMNIWPPWRGL